MYIDGKDLPVKKKLMVWETEVRCLIKNILSQESKSCIINVSWVVRPFKTLMKSVSLPLDEKDVSSLNFREIQTH